MSKVNRVLFPLGALTLSLFFAPSCVTTDLSLGSNFIPTDRNTPVEVAQFDINLGQKYPDSLQTAMSGVAIVGSINSDKWGTVNVGTALSITPEYDSIRWGGSPVFKSMSMTIPMSSCQVLDDSQYTIPQNIYIHKLKVELDSTRIYSNSIAKDDYEKSICTLSPEIFTADDSLCVRFSEDFAKPLFDLDSTVMDSTELFMKRFYGIYIETDVASSNTGRLNTLDVSSASIAFTFNSECSAGYRRDTTVYFNVGSYSSILKIDQEQTFSECDSSSTSAVYSGLMGIKPVIDARKLREHIVSLATQKGLKASAIMISKAQFDFPFEYPGSNAGFTNWPSNMYLCQRLRDTSGVVYYSPIAEIYSSTYDTGTANRSKMSYRPDAALYIQSLLNTPEEYLDDSYDLWLIPYVSMTSSSSDSSMDYYSYYYYYYYGYDPYSSSSSSTTYYYVDNMNYNNCFLYGTKAERHPTLRVTYTLLR